jgi:transposase-like protein
MPRQTLVDAQLLLSEDDIKNEKWTPRSISRATNSTEETIAFLAKRRLLANSVQCPHCDVRCNINKYSQNQDQIRWMCPKCKRYSRTIRHGSFFAQSHMKLDDLLYLMAWWSCKLPLHFIIEELKCGKHAAVDWFNFCRDVCCNWVENNPPSIGGHFLNDSGEVIAHTVEIDETVAVRRKYHRGRYIQSKWVFGGICRETRQVFMMQVRNRQADTLLPIINSHVLPGSRIISDGFASYNSLTERYDYFSHSVVIHDQFFIHPGDNDIHTQSVESMWNDFKSYIKRMRGTRHSLFKSYVAQYVWQRNFVKNDDVLSCLFLCIAMYYPL